MQDFNNFEDSSLSFSTFFNIQLKPEGNINNSTQKQQKQKTVSDQYLNFHSHSAQKYIQSLISPVKFEEFKIDNEQDEIQNDSNLQEQKKYGKKQTKKYSKKYREKQKQQLENLKTQNFILKRTIQDLKSKLQKGDQQLKRLKYGQKINSNSCNNLFQKQKQLSFNELLSTQIPESQQDFNRQQAWQKIQEFSRIYGFAGKQKINLLNYYMSQIIDSLLNDHHKRFMIQTINIHSNFEDNNNNFGSNYLKALEQKQKQILSLDDESLQSFRTRFLHDNELKIKIKKFHEFSNEFYINYVNLINQAVQIEGCFKKFKNEFTGKVCPKNYLNLINWYEKNRYDNRVQSLRKQWFHLFSVRLNSVNSVKHQCYLPEK